MIDIANPPPNNVVFAGDFDKTSLPEDYMCISTPQQYPFAILDLESGLRFTPDNIPFTVDKKQLAGEMLKAILFQLQYNHTLNIKNGDSLNFNIGNVVVMKFHKDGIDLDQEPSKPGDYWTFKELEKQWKNHLMKES